MGHVAAARGHKPAAPEPRHDGEEAREQGDRRGINAGTRFCDKLKQRKLNQRNVRRRMSMSEGTSMFSCMNQAMGYCVLHLCRIPCFNGVVRAIWIESGRQPASA